MAQPKTPQTSFVRRGRMGLEIEGLNAMLAGVANADRLMAQIWHDILRGPFGEEFLQDLKARVRDSYRTGYTLEAVGLEDKGSRGGVSIGVPASRSEEHPSSKRGNPKSISTWIESGTRGHAIPTRYSPTKFAAFEGMIYSRVWHPGIKARRPMSKTLRVFRRDAEAIYLRELDRRLGPLMNTTPGL